MFNAECQTHTHTHARTGAHTHTSQGTEMFPCDETLLSLSPPGTWVTFGGQITDEVRTVSLHLTCLFHLKKIQSLVSLGYSLDE